MLRICTLGFNGDLSIGGVTFRYASTECNKNGQCGGFREWLHQSRERIDEPLWLRTMKGRSRTNRTLRFGPICPHGSSKYLLHHRDVLNTKLLNRYSCDERLIYICRLLILFTIYHITLLCNIMYNNVIYIKYTMCIMITKKVYRNRCRNIYVRILKYFKNILIKIS